MYKAKNIRRYISHVTLCLAIVFCGTTVSARSFASEADTVKTIMEPGIYFPVKKELSSAAVSSVSGELLYKTPTSNLTNTLYGLLPGLMVKQGSGELGADGATLTIRGPGSYNPAPYAIFVDGFQTQSSYFQYLSPTEIESVSIFKDAAALAPLGMAGANGVIWVETRRGSIGKPRIHAQFRSGIQQPIQITKPLSSYEYAALYNEAVSNDNGRVWSPVFSVAQLEAYKNGTGINTDWYDRTLRSSAPYLSTDLTCDGGVKNARYFVMFGLTNTKGLYDVPTDDTHANLGLKQFYVRANFDFTMYNIFEGKIELGSRIHDRKQPAYNTANLWNNLASYPNYIYPAINDDGSQTGTTVYPDNPVASVNERGYWSTHDRNLQANSSLKEKLDMLLPGLYLSQALSLNQWTRGTYNVTREYSRWMWDDKNQQYVNTTDDLPTAYAITNDKGTNQWYWKQFRAGIGYDGSWHGHSVSAAVNYLQNAYLTDVNQNGPAGQQIKYNTQSIGGRIHYEYNGKYSGEIGFSSFGSDNFAKGNRFGFYPALSAGWILSKEAFLKENATIDFLKLRLSVGRTGYDPFNWGWNRRYIYMQYYTNTGSYYTGNGDAAPGSFGGTRMDYFANPDIFAESCMKYNLGIDATLFKGLSLTVDGFVEKRTGIVTADNTYPALLGVTAPQRNVGKTTTTGVETELNYRGSFGKVRYMVGGNLTWLKDKINFMAELEPPSPLAARTGYKINAPNGYKWIGFYEIDDFNADGSLKVGVPVPSFGVVQPGDMKYEDINGDGIIDDADMTKIGKRDFPNVFYALHAELAYEGFDFRVLFQGVAGREVNLLSVRNKTVAYENNGNVYAPAIGRWAYYPNIGVDTRAEATYPRLSTLGNENNYKNSTFWMKNGNFLRMRSVELGYTLPKKVSQKLYLDNLRVFVSGVNLLTFSKLMRDYELDPETLGGYPAMKSYNAGITIGF